MVCGGVQAPFLLCRTPRCRRPLSHHLRHVTMLSQALDQPATSALIVLLVAIWLLLHHRGLGYEAVGFSYDAVILRKEYWRLATGQLSHVDLLHIGEGRA